MSQLFCFQDCLSINFRLIGGAPPAYLEAQRNPIRGGTAMNKDSNRDLPQLSPLWRAPDTGPTLDVLGVTHTYKSDGKRDRSAILGLGIDRVARRRRASAHAYP